MCEQGNTVLVEVRRCDGSIKTVDVDDCIADLVQALNWNGFPTAACCCGHGKRPGNIALADGRELIIAKDFETGRAVDAAFPPVS